MFAEIGLTRDQSDQSPRGLRCGAGPPSVPCRIFVRKRALAPSAIGILFRLEPIYSALDPRLVDIDTDCAEPGERGESPVNKVDTPASAPSTFGRLISLEPFDRAGRNRMIGAIANRRHHLQYAPRQICA